MAVIIKDHDTIVREILSDTRETSPFTNLAPASKYRTIIELFAHYLEETYGDVNESILSAYATNASGPYLDAIGVMYGIYRRRATTAILPSETKTVKFYTLLPNFGSINNGQDITIPARTEITGINEDGERVSYRTTEDVTLLATEQEHYVGVESFGPGDKYNVPAYSLNEHSFNDYADAANRSLMVANITPITFASDDESDENYRYRILHHIQTIATANRTAIELAALVTPGVADVKIINNKYGTGSAAVVVKAITPTVPDALIDMVQKSISHVAALGTNIVAVKPAESPVQLETTLFLKENSSEQDKAAVIKAATEAIVDFINNLDIGENLYTGALAQMIVGSHPAIARIGKYNRFFDQLNVLHRDSLGYTPIPVAGDTYNTDETEKLYISSEDIALKIEVV